MSIPASMSLPPLGDGFAWTVERWGTTLRCGALLPLADHFFTTRQLWLRGEREAEDWASVVEAIGVSDGRLLRLRQVHGRRAVVCRRGGQPFEMAEDGEQAGRRRLEGGAGWPEADILVSDDPSLALAVQAADCVPLLMADRRSGAVAAVHAGWRGTAAGAAAAAVQALSRAFGARPADLVVAQGPSIGPCCYEVGEDVVEAYRDAGFSRQIDRWFSKKGDGALRLDLWAANRDQLLAAGVPAGAVHQCGLCTFDHPAWFASYRRDGKGTGRMAAVIRCRPVPDAEARGGPARSPAGA